MSLTYAQIRTFNAVVREGSFTNAAKQLGVSQPAVTAQIKAIEDAYGVQLFERTSKKLVMSNLAEALFATTEMVDDVERDAAEILSAYQDLEKGEIRVMSGAPHITMELLAVFHERFPGVRVVASFGNGSQILQAIEERKADVAILMDSPQVDRFVSVPYHAHRLMAVIPVDHPLAACRSISLADLRGCSVIFRTEQSVSQRLLNEALAAQGIEIAPALVLETREAVLEAVSSGIGIGFIFEGGSSRTNGVHRVFIDDLTEIMVEDVFCLEIQSRRRVIAAFMQVARELGMASSVKAIAAAS